MPIFSALGKVAAKASELGSKGPGISELTKATKPEVKPNEYEDLLEDERDMQGEGPEVESPKENPDVYEDLLESERDMNGENSEIETLDAHAKDELGTIKDESGNPSKAEDGSVEDADSEWSYDDSETNEDLLGDEREDNAEGSEAEVSEADSGIYDDLLEDERGEKVEGPEVEVSESAPEIYEDLLEDERGEKVESSEAEASEQSSEYADNRLEDADELSKTTVEAEIEEPYSHMDAQKSVSNETENSYDTENELTENKDVDPEADKNTEETDEPAEDNAEQTDNPDSDSTEENESKNETEDQKETDNKEKDKLTDEEINQRQQEAIKEGLKKLFKGELSNAEKGNLAEMMMDQYYISRGYKPLNEDRVTSLDQKGHQGLDGVYEKDGKYIIADAKYDQSPLGHTADGKQMSDDWALGERLDQAVGKEKADQIRDAYENGDVSKEVYHVEPSEDGNSVISETKQVDDDGSIIRNSTEQVGQYDFDEVNDQ